MWLRATSPSCFHNSPLVPCSLVLFCNNGSASFLSWKTMLRSENPQQLLLLLGSIPSWMSCPQYLLFLKQLYFFCCPPSCNHQLGEQGVNQDHAYWRAYSLFLNFSWIVCFLSVKELFYKQSLKNMLPQHSSRWIFNYPSVLRLTIFCQRTLQFH